jgi:uncharacterized protein
VFLIGGTGNDPWLKIAESLAYALGVAPLAIGYATTFAILWQSNTWRERFLRLVPAGRLALTNYLSQTVFALAVFYGIGLGLMGRVGPVWWPLIVVAVITMQLTFSRWWLERFTFGPLEWLWRQATYGRRLAIRRQT